MVLAFEFRGRRPVSGLVDGDFLLSGKSGAKRAP
jgi:hypothetical protein